MPVSITAFLHPSPSGICRLCHQGGASELVVTTAGERATFGPHCDGCLRGSQHVSLLEAMQTPAKQAPTRRTKRISQKQERRNMEAIGGRTSKASGAMSHDKSDGRLLDTVRVEAKFTTARSYRLTRDVLNKVRGECRGKEEPAVQIDFNNKLTGKVEDSWVAVPLHVWEKYVRASIDR